jgi:hypothetical protein
MQIFENDFIKSLAVVTTKCDEEEEEALTVKKRSFCLIPGHSDLEWINDIEGKRFNNQPETSQLRMLQRQ